LQARRTRPRELRTLTALLRAGCVSGDADQMEAMSDQLRQLLSSPSTALQTRVEAWAAHSEACLRLKSDRAFRVGLRYAVRHLSDAERAGVRVAQCIARAPHQFLTGSSSTILKGLSSYDWPLRASGLAAATALASRPQAAAESPQCSTEVPMEASGVARSVVVAFAEECPDLPSDGALQTGQKRRALAAMEAVNEVGWPSGETAKRRRLLRELVQVLPEVDAAVIDQDDELRGLCLVARQRLDVFLQAPRASAA